MVQKKDEFRLLTGGSRSNASETMPMSLNVSQTAFSTPMAMCTVNEHGACSAVEHRGAALPGAEVTSMPKAVGHLSNALPDDSVSQPVYDGTGVHACR